MFCNCCEYCIADSVGPALDRVVKEDLKAKTGLITGRDVQFHASVQAVASLDSSRGHGLRLRPDSDRTTAEAQPPACDCRTDEVFGRSGHPDFSAPHVRNFPGRHCRIPRCFPANCPEEIQTAFHKTDLGAGQPDADFCRHTPIRGYVPLVYEKGGAPGPGALELSGEV